MKNIKYFSDTYLERFTTKITKVVEMDDSVAIYCDNTIFHPQGGGQACDLGEFIIDGCVYQVYHTEITGEGISHVLKYHPLLLTCTGKLCTQNIDINRRLLNAKLHTAGHLISHILEAWYNNLSPVKGHHYPGSAYIEMIERERTNDTFSVGLINEKIDVLIDSFPKHIQSLELDLADVKCLRPLLNPITTKSTRVRMIEFDGFTPLPCGGTHVNSTSELKGLRVTRVKRKKDRIKISYLIN